MSGDRIDIRQDLHNISRHIEELKRDINKNGRAIDLNLQRMYYVCLFISISICVGLARLAFFFNQFVIKDVNNM